MTTAWYATINPPCIIKGKVGDRLFMSTFTRIPYTRKSMPGLLWLSCSSCPLPDVLFYVLSRLSYPSVLSMMSCYGFPELAVLSRLSCSGCPVPAVVSSCRRVPAVLYQMPCQHNLVHSSPDAHVLPSCHVLVSPVFSVQAHL